ncbi:peroxiredoxin [Aquabacterium sp. J223]|uniref:peroxiredoxin n=1 Tax=Aquabacterium sp. J223 TaxID=2898431 RepID=UPI0021AE0740|nr:peroxiredoxin [Aquabacterium sp. J223]UUX93966.1 peroxiredoxin [Aquabacterium sp. J223]
MPSLITPRPRSRRGRHLAVAALLSALVTPPAVRTAQAALPVGADAPNFSAEAAVGGQAFRFSLADALKQGPVVLYFFPKAFTSGCTVEAHQFAEATDRFKALGASVIGMSNDGIETLKKFSVEACRNRFPVAADAGAKVMKQYDAALRMVPGMADRVSYVISPQGRILHSHVSMNPDGHVDATLKAVEAWRAQQPSPQPTAR